MEKMMVDNNRMKKMAADSLQSMLTAERIPTNTSKRWRGKCTIAADGVKLPYMMKGWGKSTWRQSEDGVIYKFCKGCKKFYPISEFSILEEYHNTSRDGRSQYCSKCRSKKSIAKAKKGQTFQVKLDDNENLNQGLTAYSDAELLRELRLRGFKGELTFTKIITV